MKTSCIVKSNVPERAMPNSTDARRELGRAYRGLGRNDDARAEWEAVAQARPQDDHVHHLLANLYRQLGEADHGQSGIDRIYFDGSAESSNSRAASEPGARANARRAAAAARSRWPRAR